jgi:hypothetical protein
MASETPIAIDGRLALGKQPSNRRLQRTALRAAAEPPDC